MAGVRNHAQLPSQAVQVVFILSSYQGYSLKNLSSIQAIVYEGSSHSIDKEFIHFDMVSDASFDGSSSLIMARMYRKDDQWMFEPLITPIAQAKVNQVLDHYAHSYFYSS